MAAGMWDIGFCAAIMIGTSGHHMRTMDVPAPGHGLQGFEMAWQNGSLIARKEPLPEPVDNRRESDHLTPPQVISKVSARELIAWRALFLVTVVRWV
jgi:hypothetical protein